MSTYVEKTDAYDFITLILAVALIAAPWALGYSGDRTAIASSVVAGLAIGACAVVALTEFTRLFEEIDVALGALTVAAPWIVGFAHNRHAVIAHVVVGGLVVLVSLSELFLLRGRPPRANA